jgi:chemotaxis protein CheX
VPLASTDVLNAFYATTVAIFDQVGHEPLHRTELRLDGTNKTSEDLAALIAVTGELEGMVVLEMGRATAKRLASTMLGTEVLMYDPLVESAIGELDRLQVRCDIAPPAVISGKGVEIVSVGIPAVTASFKGTSGNIVLRIALRTQDDLR